MIQNGSKTPEIVRLRDAGDWVQDLKTSDDPALTEQWLHWCESDPLNLSAFEIQGVCNDFSGSQAR